MATRDRDVEPSSARPSTSDRDRDRDGLGGQSGPIPLFDQNLRVLGESYLAFFQERKRIEEIYIDSLLKLHRKVQAIDTSIDYRLEPSTTRSAWSEVRDNVEREAQTRQAFLNTLASEVITPLVALRDSQDRTRKRIKEDLKDSLTAYTDYAENTLPKLKRVYLKKCQDVEDYKTAASATSPIPTSNVALNSPEFSALPSNVRTRASVDNPGRPTVTAPQPLRPLDRRPSGSTGPISRNRSPSTSTGTALSDLAQHGKKQFNQLVTSFLDKRETMKDGLSSSRSSDAALRHVRAKREADEADKEYRRAVHWLETLRIRRSKTLEAAYKSMELFVNEMSGAMKGVLERYTDNMIATQTTLSQLSTHLRTFVDRISPTKDASALAARLPRALASSVPKPILYYNYHVGECADLIFGVSLVDYATSRALPDGEVPKIVRICLREIEGRGLDAEGIYRVSGRHAIVQELQHKIERNERAFKFNPLTDDVYAVASLLKLYLRELPEPVFRFSLQDRIQHSEDLDDHVANHFVLLRSKIRRLPAVHQATLRALLEHLNRVVARSEKNKMDAKNLAIVFGTVIFGEDELPKQSADLLAVQSYKDSMMEDLIEHASAIYEDAPHPPLGHAQAQGQPPSPPLPPAPSGEPAPTYPLGSSYTKVTTVPPMPPRPTQPQPHGGPVSQPAVVVAASATAGANADQGASRSAGDKEKEREKDFTPQLPLRPTSSIHPGARGPTTPRTERAEPMSPLSPTRPNAGPLSNRTATQSQPYPGQPQQTDVKAPMSPPLSPRRVPPTLPTRPPGAMAPSISPSTSEQTIRDTIGEEEVDTLGRTATVRAAERPRSRAPEPLRLDTATGGSAAGGDADRSARPSPVRTDSSRTTDTFASARSAPATPDEMGVLVSREEDPTPRPHAKGASG
ncbi:RhoGAP-domain-containing protein [Punctularia strigosozonata HHB-11173 SS5]|uniref:RhoGAP-domain-containing protein n=1 Tax=Punctularia strigosozonata (strain HHB-11173) TaxID=741275 RepID=UPI00044164D0|nr:RhoGAP-domain-containing protein [Punctularia strigosozonata HHB-11173 SS5]EIN13461.1 RhoGAP-domain-containing protein [Punctularia strigosozonata HHB-11173 SS5]